MAYKSQQIADMVDMLPEQEQDFAFEFVKRLVKAWDPDFTKLTPAERQQLEHAEKSGFISDKDIDWNNLNSMNL